MQSREIKFRAWVGNNKNKYDKELEDYRNKLYKEGKRFGRDRFSYNKTTKQMFEKDNNINYEQGKYIEYKMDYNPSIDGESNGRGSFADINFGLSQQNFMQYTGLKDKNGVEIYEGDIIICDNCTPDRNKPFEVKCDGTMLYIDRSFHNYMKTPIACFGEWCHIEVVGNIYQHPDLLVK